MRAEVRADHHRGTLRAILVAATTLSKKSLDAHRRVHVGPKTRVGVFDLAPAPRVGARARRSTESRWEFSARRREVAVGSRWYLQPEPILRDPRAQVRHAYQGRSLPVYAYAANNPLYYVDSDGRELYIPWATRAFGSIFWPEQLRSLESAVEKLSRPGCRCGLTTGSGYPNAPWDTRDIGVVLDPSVSLSGAAGWSNPLTGMIYLDPGQWDFGSTIAHEAGHFRPPYGGHDENPKRFNGENSCSARTPTQTDLDKLFDCKCP